MLRATAAALAAAGVALSPITTRGQDPATQPAGAAAAVKKLKYPDGRPEAPYRIDAKDHGVVLRHGEPFDAIGARDVVVWADRGRYLMHYDAAGPTGWLVGLAVSKDLVTWQKKGLVTQLGKKGETDSGTASYGVPIKDGDAWHLFYIGTPNTTPPPERVPSLPYQTLKARSKSPTGPWAKQKDVVPFRCVPGTYYADTASPGQIVKVNGEYLQFFSAAIQFRGVIKRTIGIARTKDLDQPWTIDPEPIVPLEEQIENSSLYYQAEDKTWFLFTNHVGTDAGGEYTDAVWVYWSDDVTRWDARNKAVVLDGTNCTWSKKVVGLPSVMKKDNRLAILYDGAPGESTSHVGRDVGLAWLDLPIKVPTSK
jgi:predicted GH43/DUF377 family glycosyl hydrolase